MPAIYRNGTRYGNAPTSYPAENVAYDPTTSKLPATNAQNAIDELADATPRILSAGPASVVTFDTDTVAPLQSLKCEINATGGNGTPDNPNPINGYSSANITRCGVNLYDNIYAHYRRPVNYLIKDIPLEIGKTYTLKATLKSGGVAVTGCYVGVASKGEQYSEFSNMVSCVKVYGTTATQTFMPTNTWTSPKLIIYDNENENLFNSLFENYEISLVEGTASNYRPYTDNTYTIAFGQTVYGGVLDATRGKLHVTWVGDTINNLPIQYWAGGVVFYANITDKKNGNTNVISDIFETLQNGGYGELSDGQIVGRSDGNTIYIKDTAYTDVSAFKSARGNGLIVYELATPFDIDLTPEVISAIVGVNNVYSDTNGDTEVKYYTSGASIIKDLIDATPIDDLANVSISSPANNQILTYNSTTSKWENKAPVVDSSLSSTSTNPVQNKVINTALDGKADKATTYTKTEVDDKFEDIKPIGTATGNPCSFETDAALPLASLKASIVTTGGNGSPDSPNPIVGHSELNLVRCGKNFVALNASPYQSAVNTEVSVNSESTDLLSITSSAVPYACRQLYYKLPAGTYTVSLGETTKTGTDNPVISIYDYPNGTLIVNALSANNNVVFTLSDETVLDIRLFATGNTAEVNTVTFNDFQIELGSSSSPYAPYNGQTFTVSFGQTVYGGAYDANRGKVHVTYGKDSFANKSWTQYSTGFFAFNFSDAKANANGLCEIYEVVVDKSYANAPDNSMQLRGTTVLVKDTSCADITALIARVGSAEFIYELATPIEIDVSELSVDTIVGVNNIVSDCGGDITVEYLKNADMAEFVETIHNSLSPIILTGTLNAGETSITFSSDAITEDSLIEIYTDPNIFYTGTTTSDGEIEITFPERQYNVSVKVRII